MKFINRPERTVSTILYEVPLSIRERFLKYFRNKPVQREILEFPGRMEISNAVIEFDEEPELYQKLDVTIEDIEIIGLMPFKRIDHLIYECYVDDIIQK